MALLFELDSVSSRAVDGSSLLDVPQAHADGACAFWAWNIDSLVGEAGHAHPFRLGARWLSAEAAADLDALPVRPSRSTLDASLATLALVLRFLAIVGLPARCAPPSGASGRMIQRCNTSCCAHRGAVHLDIHSLWWFDV